MSVSCTVLKENIQKRGTFVNIELAIFSNTQGPNKSVFDLLGTHYSAT